MKEPSEGKRRVARLGWVAVALLVPVLAWCGESQPTAGLQTGSYLLALGEEASWPAAPPSFLTERFLRRMLDDTPPPTSREFCDIVLRAVPQPVPVLCLSPDGVAWQHEVAVTGLATESGSPPRGRWELDGNEVELLLDKRRLTLRSESVEGNSALSVGEGKDRKVWIHVTPEFYEDFATWHSMIQEDPSPPTLGDLMVCIALLSEEWRRDYAARALGRAAPVRTLGRSDARRWVGGVLGDGQSSFSMVAASCIVLALMGTTTVECELMLKHLDGSDPELRAVVRWAIREHLLQDVPAARTMPDGDLARLLRERVRERR